ncbi:FKBP-type peptidyl-prolyl cis-trans isomerase [Microbacterium sp. NPDC008134]|uniref:FKBP-type peptidyl-prolyl cis-trans isomerase n=1 Tax=Microbacterium sp. NPDC008134 TaxID=3364183 RepID=UPI0036F0F0AE
MKRPARDLEGSTVRKRPLLLLSTVAAATLLLAGCAGGAEPESSATPDETAGTTSCLADVASGAGSDAVTVDGTDADAKVTVPEGTEITEPERSVITEGDGDEVVPGDLVSLRYQLIDATTNEVLSSSERGPDGILSALLASQQQQISDPTQSTVFTVAAECLPIGSSVVLTLPASQEGLNPSVLYVQTIEKLPTIASGTDVDPEAGMPTVELDADGAPTITLPDGDAPAETKVAVLKQGDGATVAEGDLVTVQYRGIKWSDGSEFDSSWSRGAAPAQFPTTGVVTGFKKALEGQKVGSQVIVTMPPSEAYGDNEGNELQNESLVFVVDILATTPPEQVQQ